MLRSRFRCGSSRGLELLSLFLIDGATPLKWCRLVSTCERNDSHPERDSSHSFDCCIGMLCAILESLVYPEDEEWLAEYRVLVDVLMIDIGKVPFPDSAISTH